MREVEAMKVAQSQGKNYSFIKKSNKPMALPGGKEAGKRGSVVSSTTTVTKPKLERPSVSLEHGLSIGKEKKTYTPARAFTGHAEYGKENPNNPDAKFIEDARKKKQDIAYDKDQKPYRAGVTTISKDPDKGFSKLTIHKGSSTPGSSVTKVDVKEPVAGKMKQKFGIIPKRKIERVDYLRAKDAKGGISKERRRRKNESGHGY